MAKKDKKFVLFYINGEQFAMPLLEDSQFIACDRTMPFPKSNDKVLGLIYHSGNIVTILNTAKFLNIKYKYPEESNCLLFSYNKDYYALVVDEGSETKKADKIFTDRNKKHFKNYIKVDKQKVYIVEPDKILEELKIYD